MLQPVPLTGVDYDRTLVVAIELSSKNWVLAAQVPGLLQAKARRTIEPTKEALFEALHGYHARAVAAGRQVERVVAIYEAGWSGFWLARWLQRHGIEVHVNPALERPNGPTPASGEVRWHRCRVAVAHTVGMASRRTARLLDGADP